LKLAGQACVPNLTGPRPFYPLPDAASPPAADEVVAALLALRAKNDLFIGNPDVIRPTAADDAAGEEANRKISQGQPA